MVQIVDGRETGLECSALGDNLAVEPRAPDFAALRLHEVFQLVPIVLEPLPAIDRRFMNNRHNDTTDFTYRHGARNEASGIRPRDSTAFLAGGNETNYLRMLLGCLSLARRLCFGKPPVGNPFTIPLD